MSKSIAVCIPSHNCGPYLRSTIESVLYQRSPADEIIISDDHSTDDSVAILNDYADDPRIRIIHQEKRLSIGEHYRFLLETAQSDYVCFLSADDVLLENFVANMRAAITDGDPTLVIGACVETDGKLGVIRTRHTARRDAMPATAAFRYMAGANNYTMSFALMRRNVLLSAPALPTEMDVVTDWYWALSLARAGTLAFVTKPSGYYRVHGHNAGHGNDKWGIAARKMVAWMMPQLNAEEKAALNEKMSTAQQAPVRKAQSTVAKDRLKDIVKRAAALRYAAIPAAVRRAEGR